MTISQALKSAADELRSAKISLPPLEAEILLSETLKKPREFLLAHEEKNLTKSQFSNFKFQISRRLKGEPIAYLIGRKEFYGLNFAVNKNVLVPRPETELMVEEALKLITCNSQLMAQSSKSMTLIDVGTGSGCVIITLAKLINNYQLPITNYKFVATDISAKALTVARKNAKNQKVDKKIKFLQGDLLAPLLQNSLFACPSRACRSRINYNSFIILANLPYGWKAWKNNCTQDTIGLKFEPQAALFAKKNGLGLYEQLLKQIRSLINLRKLALNSKVLLEFDPRQTVMIKKLIKKYLPKAQLKIKKDLAGHNRLAIISIEKLY